MDKNITKLLDEAVRDLKLAQLGIFGHELEGLSGAPVVPHNI